MQPNPPLLLRFWVNNPNSEYDDCRIHYREINGHLKRDEKLKMLSESVSVKGFGDWQIITPNEYYDWIEQRSDAFTDFYPVGSKDAKAGKADDAIFGLYSRGLSTGKDTYIYNFSRDTCAEKAKLMTQDYLAALSELKAKPNLTVDEVTRRYSTNIKWDRELKNNLKRKKETEFDDNYIRKVVYRPFVPDKLLCRLYFCPDEIQDGFGFP